MRLFAFAVVILCVAGSCRSEDNFEAKFDGLLIEVCKGNNPVTFEDVGQATSLLSAFHRNPLACADDFWDSFRELEKLLAPENLMDVCAENFYKLFEKYHTSYIAKDAPKKIPEALFNFFVVFGQGVRYHQIYLDHHSYCIVTNANQSNSQARWLL